MRPLGTIAITINIIIIIIIINISSSGFLNPSPMQRCENDVVL